MVSADFFDKKHEPINNSSLYLNEKNFLSKVIFTKNSDEKIEMQWLRSSLKLLSK